ncbi:vesicle-associated membrane protein 7 [Sipha flava]|uniref:Vesicle-associated membrane protein 7 n=1 Tax=Sipha flava TaxID=143950 RepID=A0A8B8GGX1_9HEMI|nr:vesicle-associated membrane protein 7 [Sipha flava]XP_025421831.1 vesicle-associated membrane protein 7 [Sipha flava]XP_025421832.1 vesicle-associated membrane protein 7 [Sipha flava]
MPLFYSVVTRGMVVLAKHANYQGNFGEILECVLTQIGPENKKQSLLHDRYLYHYICEDQIIYMCITDDEFQRSKAFFFLNEIKRRFQATYSVRAQNAIAYSMNSEFAPILASEMKRFSNLNEFDTLSKVHGQLDELKDIMVRNIDNVALRGEKLELLVNKTENLCSQSMNFRVQSRTLQRSLFWKNVKIYVLFVLIGIAIIYFVAVFFCGSLVLNCN